MCHVRYKVVAKIIITRTQMVHMVWPIRVVSPVAYLNKNQIFLMVFVCAGRFIKIDTLDLKRKEGGGEDRAFKTNREAILDQKQRYL